MKHILILAAVIFIASCHHGTNDKSAETKPADSTIVIQKDSGNGAAKDSGMNSADMNMESFGDISLGQKQPDLVKILGEPDKKSKAQEWGADGMMHEDWTYTSHGLVLNMVSEKKGTASDKTISTIIATLPCAYKTKAGSGIGSSYQEVAAVYKGHTDPESDQNQIIVGSVYGGIIFDFKEGKVVKISIGAFAE